MVDDEVKNGNGTIHGFQSFMGTKSSSWRLKNNLPAIKRS